MSRTKQYSSKDFHKTYARPEFKMPEKLIHKAVEQEEVHDQFSTERKHPVFLLIYPPKI